MWKSTGPQKGKPDGMGLRKGAILQPARPGRAFKGLGGAKQYCSINSIGDRFIGPNLWLQKPYAGAISPGRGGGRTLQNFWSFGIKEGF